MFLEFNYCIVTMVLFLFYSRKNGHHNFTLPGIKPSAFCQSSVEFISLNRRVRDAINSFKELNSFSNSIGIKNPLIY